MLKYGSRKCPFGYGIRARDYYSVLWAPRIHSPSGISIGSAQWRIQDFCKGVRQLVTLECPKPLHALSPSDR